MANPQIKCPRALHYAHVVNCMDGEMLGEYREMAKRCAFPAAWQNGLFHFCFGLLFFFSGMGAIASSLIGMETIDFINYFFIGAGVVVGLVLVLIVGLNLQTKVLFPRDTCMLGNDEKANTIKFAIPMGLFAMCAVFCFLTRDNYGYVSAVASIFALIGLFTYSKTNRGGIFTLSLIVFLVPTIIMRLSLFPVDDLFTIIAMTVAIDAVFYAVCGLLLMNRALNGPATYRVGEKLASYLPSKDERQRAIAANYLVRHLDPRVAAELLMCTDDENPVVRFIAQVAFSNSWGPKTQAMVIDPMPSQLAGNPLLGAPMMENDYDDDYDDYDDGYDDYDDYDDYDEQIRKDEDDKAGGQSFGETFKKEFAARMAAAQGAVDPNVSDVWLKHQRRVEATVREIAMQNEEAFSKLIKLAMGSVSYRPAQRTAIEMLGSSRSPQGYSALTRLLLAQERRVSKAAIVGFFGAGSDVLPYLERFFAAKRSWVRRRAICAARMMLDYLWDYQRQDYYLASTLLEPSIDLLMSYDDTTTFAAAIALLPFETEEEIEVIEAYCMNDRPIIRIEAMNALAICNPERAKEWVFSALLDDRVSVRYAAVLLCKTIATPEARKALERVFDDPDPMVKKAVIETVQWYRDHTAPGIGGMPQF